MTHWHMRYDLDCGHSSGWVTCTDKGKRGVGDTWTCAICGTDRTIERAGGHGA